MSQQRHHKLSRAVIVMGTILLSVNAGLASILWVAWWLPMSEQSPQPVSLPGLSDNPSIVPPAPDSVEDILSRPVFAASRRPFVPPPPPPPPEATQIATQPPPQPSPPPDLVVDGILLNGGVRKAHLRKQSDVGGAWQAEGDAIEGWTITAISDAKVVLKRDQQLMEVELYPAEKRT